VGIGRWCQCVNDLLVLLSHPFKPMHVSFVFKAAISRKYEDLAAEAAEAEAKRREEIEAEVGKSQREEEEDVKISDPRQHAHAPPPPPPLSHFLSLEPLDKQRTPPPPVLFLPLQPTHPTKTTHPPQHLYQQHQKERERRARLVFLEDSRRLEAERAASDLAEAEELRTAAILEAGHATTDVVRVFSGWDATNIGVGVSCCKRVGVL
jgi:hypothetical protein